MCAHLAKHLLPSPTPIFCSPRALPASAVSTQLQGYILGHKEALASIGEEISRRTKTAYTEQVLEDEKARAAIVEAEVARLEARSPR